MHLRIANTHKLALSRTKSKPRSATISEQESCNEQPTIFFFILFTLACVCMCIYIVYTLYLYIYKACVHRYTVRHTTTFKRVPELIPFTIYSYVHRTTKKCFIPTFLLLFGVWCIRIISDRHFLFPVPSLSLFLFESFKALKSLCCAFLKLRGVMCACMGMCMIAFVDPFA